MTYIIQHNFGQEEPPYYYVRVLDNISLVETYDPELATQFKSEDEAQHWIDVNSPMKEYSKVVGFNDCISEYMEWKDGGSVRRVLECIDRSMSRPYNGEGLEDVIDWRMFYCNNDDKIDYDDYITWPELHSISNHLWELDHYSSWDRKEEYISFAIYTRRDGDYRVFEKELNMVIDMVTYKDEDGYLIFPIFDHYLSEHGNSVSLLIHPETKKVKIYGRYSSNNKEYDSLESAFEYMKAERYYE